LGQAAAKQALHSGLELTANGSASMEAVPRGENARLYVLSNDVEELPSSAAACHWVVSLTGPKVFQNTGAIIAKSAYFVDVNLDLRREISLSSKGKRAGGDASLL